MIISTLTWLDASALNSFAATPRHIGNAANRDLDLGRVVRNAGDYRFLHIGSLLDIRALGVGKRRTGNG